MSDSATIYLRDSPQPFTPNSVDEKFMDNEMVMTTRPGEDLVEEWVGDECQRTRSYFGVGFPSEMN
jgi:hypothetical protein